MNENRPSGIPAGWVQTGPDEWSAPSRVLSGRAGLRPNDAKPVEGSALVSPPPREETRWYGSARRFEIRFIVYSLRPADWDGYEIKQIQDWLVHAGILPSDAWNVVVQGQVTSCKAHSKEEERTDIAIRTISETSE